MSCIDAAILSFEKNNMAASPAREAEEEGYLRKLETIRDIR